MSKPRKESNRLLYMIVFAVVGIVAMIASSPNHSSVVFETSNEPSTKAPAPEPLTEVPEELGPPTADQEHFMYKVFLPTLTRLRREYPVESVRIKFDRALKRTEQDPRTERAEVAFNVVRNKLEQSALYISYNNDGQLTIGVVIAGVRRRFKELEDDPEAIEDMLISSILHEFFHLDNHNIKLDPIKDYQEMARRESEAWIYSVEQVLQPMQLAGRMITPSGADAGALAAYQAAGGDPNHYQWQRFSRWACGYED